MVGEERRMNGDVDRGRIEVAGRVMGGRAWLFGTVCWETISRKCNISKAIARISYNIRTIVSIFLYIWLLKPC